MSELYSMLKAKKTGASSGGGGGATVNNATITIQKNGTTVDSFTSNQATDKTINITVPTSAADVSAIPTTAKGANSGVAELDANGKIPSSQLPSYVDDVIEGYYYDSKFYEDSEHTTEITGTTGKIYVDLLTNKTYRWSGSGYTEISESLALGETSSTAYRGDRGKTAYDHATDSSRHTTAETSGLYKFATTAEGHIASVSEVQKSDITELGIPGQDTTVGSGIVLTGYTSESPAQSDTIVATDNVNEAIKKLDERSRVDENNISLIKHAANSSIYIQETQPESGNKGDYWISTTGTKIYHYSNNLFDGVLLAGVWDTVDTRTSTDSNAYKSFKLNLPAGTYTISFAVAVNIVRLIKDGTLLENLDENATSYTVTTTTENDLGFSFRIAGTPHTPWDNSNIMLNSGSRVLPYEPYDEYSGQWV